MKKLTLLLIALPALVAASFAQGIQLPSGVSVFAKSTGLTTGHAFSMYVQNDAGFPQKVTIPPVAIPSEEGKQGYVVPEPVTVTVPANSTETLPAHAFCTDHHLQAHAEGVLLPRINTWNPQSRLVPLVQQILKVTSDLQTAGQIKTPYSDDPNRELTTVAQHVVWVATAPPGKPCTAADFCARTKREFTTATGTPALALPPALAHGMAQIWDAVIKVGRQTGIPAFMPPTLPPAAATLPDAPPSTLPAIINLIRVTGTGRTTGHIADLAVANPAAEPIQFRFGPNTSPSGVQPGTSAYIPSGGGYQPYIIPYLPHVTVPPGQTVTIPVQGFCTDVRKAPVPLGNAMPPISSWVTPKPSYDGIEPSNQTGPQVVVTVPTRTAPSLDEAVNILQSVTPGNRLPSTAGNTDCPDGLLAPVPTLPGTDTPIPTPVNPETHPAVGVPLLLDAIQRIARTYDELKQKGAIITPFGGNPEKEREAVIQQTFWIYTASLRGEPYEKQDFRGNTLRQFEQNTGKTYAQIPQPQQEKMDKGVDDFWDSFEAVGAEAKILPRVPEPPKPVPSVDEFFNSTIPGGLKHGGATNAPVPTDPHQTVANPVKPEAPAVPIKDEKPDKQCQCGDISFELLIWDTEVVPPNGWRGVGTPFKKAVTMGSKPGAPEEVIKAGKTAPAKGSTQIVELKKIEIQCPCVNFTEAVKEAVAALGKLNKDSKTRLDKAREELAKARADSTDAENKLAAERAKKKPNQVTIRNQEKVLDKAKEKITEAQSKVNELEAPIKAKETEIDNLKKTNKDSDCPVYADAKKTSDLPGVMVKEGNNTVKGEWYEETGKPDNDNFKFSLVKGDGPMTCTIEVSFFCQSDACKPVSCSRKIVLAVDE